MKCSSNRIWTVLLLRAIASHSFACAQDGWTTGRVTFYDDNTEGACRYGRGIPTYYAAWPDGQSGAPACGRCYEVQCVNRNFNDGYSKRLSRMDACSDESESVIVKVVDSCPCVHENYYSNQRWCCNDAPHLDLGRTAFRKLSRESLGVVGARWRPVSCPEGYEGSQSGAVAYASASASGSGASASASASSSSSNDDGDDSDTFVYRRRRRSRSSSSSGWFFGHK